MLVVALIMLLVLTLIAVTASNIAQTNLKVVQNMESREMALAAAEAALEEAVSSNDFAATPDAIFNVTQCGINCREYDFNRDGTADIEVQAENPVCVSVVPIRNADLNVDLSTDADCFLPPGEYSMCGDSVWEFRVRATDLLTGATVNVRQGVSIKTTFNNIATACPGAV